MNVPPIGLENLVQAIIAKSPSPELPIAENLQIRFFELSDLDRRLTCEALSNRILCPMRPTNVRHFVTLFHTLLSTQPSHRIPNLPSLWQTQILPLFTETTLSLCVTNLPALAEASPYHYIVMAALSGIRLIEQRDTKREWVITFSGDTLTTTFNGHPCDRQFVAELIDKWGTVLTNFKVAPDDVLFLEERLRFKTKTTDIPIHSPHVLSTERICLSTVTDLRFIDIPQSRIRTRGLTLHVIQNHEGLSITAEHEGLPKNVVISGGKSQDLLAIIADNPEDFYFSLISSDTHNVLITINGRLRGGGKIDRGDHIEVIPVPSRPHERIRIPKALGFTDPHIDELAKAIYIAYKQLGTQIVFSGKRYTISVTTVTEGIGDSVIISLSRASRSRSSSISGTSSVISTVTSLTINPVPETNEVETTTAIAAPIHLSLIEMGCVFQDGWTIQVISKDLIRAKDNSSYFGSGKRSVGLDYFFKFTGLEERTMGNCISLLGEVTPVCKTLNEVDSSINPEAFVALRELATAQGFGDYFTFFPKVNGYNLCEILFDPKYRSCIAAHGAHYVQALGKLAIKDICLGIRDRLIDFDSHYQLRSLDANGKPKMNIGNIMLAIPEEFLGACSDVWIAIDNDPQFIESPQNLEWTLSQLPEIAHRITLSFQQYFDYTNNQIQKFNNCLVCLKDFRDTEFTNHMKMKPIIDPETDTILETFIQNFESCFGMTGVAFSDYLKEGFKIGATETLNTLLRIESREIRLTPEQMPIFQKIHSVELVLQRISLGL